jgi:hypothetical protein
LVGRRAGALLSASEQARVRALMKHATGKEGAAGAAPSTAQAGQAAWGGACVAIAFRSLKLIVDDFLEVCART